MLVVWTEVATSYVIIFGLLICTLNHVLRVKVVDLTWRPDFFPSNDKETKFSKVIDEKMAKFIIAELILGI